MAEKRIEVFEGQEYDLDDPVQVKNLEMWKKLAALNAKTEEEEKKTKEKVQQALDSMAEEEEPQPTKSSAGLMPCFEKFV